MCKIMKEFFNKLFFVSILVISTSFAVANEDYLDENPSINENNHGGKQNFFEHDIVQGDKNADVVVVEYFSFTCPHCAYFHSSIYPKLKAKYIDTKKIAFVQREYVGTRQDLEASVLARCAGKDKRLQFYDVLLSNQETWAFNRNFDEILKNIAQMGGVSQEEFDKCLNDDKLIRILMNNSKIINRTPGFVGTPVFVINNKVHKGNFSLEVLGKVIDNHLGEDN